MGRTLGPFTDVSTARVDGAYEIYEGSDEEGRPVEILTLGAVSSKDPARRALLSDTVAWAHATRGPADAPILSADLVSEQPYVVTLRRTGFRGVERLMERMLAMGPSSGPLQLAGGAHTGQIPVIHTDPRGIPMPGTTPPAGSPAIPASPAMPYLTRPAPRRPGWLVPLVIALTLVVIVGGGLTVYFGILPTGNAPASEDQPMPTTNETPTDDGSSEPAPGTTPTIDTSLNEVFLPNTTSTMNKEDAEVIAQAGWPFAFHVPAEMKCERANELALSCTIEDGDRAGTEVLLRLEDCAGDCDTDRRDDMVAAWNGGDGAADFDDDTLYRQTFDDGYQLSLSRFFAPKQNAQRFAPTVQLTVSATTPYGGEDLVDQIVNDILTQTS
ncbi:hypothetical protein [Stackebrandtia soli]|uniref:hypothetical protein n=1 Tax=Stackebrandtia soli TaxID=1892856 RepID=UPI0039EB593D